jgi:hypothetical protein
MAGYSQLVAIVRLVIPQALKVERFLRVSGSGILHYLATFAIAKAIRIFEGSECSWKNDKPGECDPGVKRSEVVIQTWSFVSLE